MYKRKCCPVPTWTNNLYKRTNDQTALAVGVKWGTGVPSMPERNPPI